MYVSSVYSTNLTLTIIISSDLSDLIVVYYYLHVIFCILYLFLYEFVIDMLKSFNPIQIAVPNEALLLLQCAKHHHETSQLDVVQQTMHPHCTCRATGVATTMTLLLY